MKFMESRKSLRDQIKFLLPPLIELHTSFIYILYIHPLYRQLHTSFIGHLHKKTL